MSTVGRSAPITLTLLCAATATQYCERVGFEHAFDSIARMQGLSTSVVASVFGAYFWGMAVSQAVAGFLTQRYGGARVLLGAFVLAALVSTATVFLLESPGPLAVCRGTLGVLNGSVSTAAQAELAGLSDKGTRGVAVQALAMMQNLTTGILIFASPSLLRMLGPHGLVASLVGVQAAWIAARVLCTWRGRACSHPEEGRDGLFRVVDRDASLCSGCSHSTAHIPWGGFLTSPAVQSIMFCRFAYCAVTFTLAAWLPAYLRSGTVDSTLALEGSSLGMDAARAAPFLIAAVASVLSGRLSDAAVRFLGVWHGRRLVNTMGMLPAVALLLALTIPGVASEVGALLALTIFTGVLVSLEIARGGYYVAHLVRGARAQRLPSVVLTPTTWRVHAGYCTCFRRSPCWAMPFRGPPWRRHGPLARGRAAEAAPGRLVEQRLSGSGSPRGLRRRGLSHERGGG